MDEFEYIVPVFCYPTQIIILQKDQKHQYERITVVRVFVVRGRRPILTFTHFGQRVVPVVPPRFRKRFYQQTLTPRYVVGFLGMFSQAETIELDERTFGIRHSNVEIGLIVVLTGRKIETYLRIHRKLFEKI
jgi:hypothetical protein